jgi:hypothetical protein
MDMLSSEKSPVNKLVLEDIFMIRSVSNVTSFSHPALPDSVHFSISHRPQDEYCNFHVSKNVADEKNKPKIEVCRIKREGLAPDFEILLKHFVFALLEPVNHKNGYRYADMQELQTHKRYARLRKSIFTTFQKHAKPKGKREFRITRSVQDGFKKWALEKKTQGSLFRNLKKLPNRFSHSIKGGILISQKECTGLFVINGLPYKLKATQEFDTVLEKFIEPGLLQTLTEKMFSAIRHVSVAQTYVEVEPYDKGIEICIIH